MGAASMCVALGVHVALPLSVGPESPANAIIGEHW